MNGYQDVIRNRIRTWISVFDGPLALIVFLIMSVGIITLYSAGIDFPGRVEDQLRNILICFVIMWIAASVPPQTLMRFAVPIYTVGIALLLVRVDQKGRASLAQSRHHHPAVGDHEDRIAVDAGLVFPETGRAYRLEGVCHCDAAFGHSCGADHETARSGNGAAGGGDRFLCHFPGGACMESHCRHGGGDAGMHADYLDIVA